MMRLVGFLIIVIVNQCVNAYKYKYDHLDIDEILNNRRLVNYYAACMLDRGPCPPEGMEFKRIFPEALQTNCLKCTEKQKTVILRALKRLRREYPRIWELFANEWDPEDQYYQKFIKTFNKAYSDPSLLTDPPTPSTTTSTTTTTTTTTTTLPPSPPSSTIVIGNRFGDDEGSNADANNVISSSFGPINQFSTTASTTTTTTQRPTMQPNRPSATSTNNNNINPMQYPTNTRPTANVGPNNIYNNNKTVSPNTGTNIVNGVVRRLGNFGSNLVNTGVRIADGLLKGVQRVIRPMYPR